IELPVHSRNTAKLPPRPAVETDQAEPAPQRRDSAKVLAANAPGGGPTPRTTGGGGQPPMRGSFGDSGRGGGGGSRRSGPRWWVAALLIFLAVLLVSSILITLAYAYPNQMGPIAGMLPKGSPTTKITITPDNKVISNSYVILAVPGKADPNQRQVTSRSLTSPAQKNTRTVKATGHNKTNGTVATGMFTFLNGTSTPKTIPAGQQIPASNGVTFTTTAQANMPASNLTSGFIGKATVPARANTVGTDGNIRAGAVNKSCCSANNDISVINNAAFSGGQDPKDYNFVKQGDYDSAVNALTGQLTQQANAALTSQIKTTEQLAAQSRCPATVTRNNQVGDHGVNVNSVDVTVSVTCNAVAYDQAGMQSIVMKLLQDKAAQDLGEGYALKGNLVTQSRVQSVNPDKSVSLIVDSKGLWVYQFPNDFKTQVAKSVAGMTVNQANTTIKGMKGVQNVTISTNGGNLPGDTAQIEVVIQDLAPLPGVTPTPGPSGPVTTPPGQNTPQPGNG
ncbi:MAG: baseplate J/gp47 family protein, partial [Ktedonobacteraceae bacterium]|nr:baseplate J/gp47 family protein [Ktedonobacteraceae bacterium]